jgi:hypothetical protein
MDVYLDTNLWSRLLQQPTDDDELVSILAGRGVRLIVGDSDICELFESYPFCSDSSPHLTMSMFSRLRPYIAGPNTVLKVNMELLAAEMHATNKGQQTIDQFLNAEDHDVYRALVGRVSNGVITQQDRDHVSCRRERVMSNRDGQQRHMQSELAVKGYLTTVAPERLGEWLDIASLGPDSMACLAWEIRNYFPADASMIEASEWAAGLLSMPHWRMSRAIVRRNLYMNWRSARSQASSIPRDLLVDTDHVLNAVYCDMYATEEGRQAKFARLLLTDATAVRIYHREEFTSVANWLIALTPESESALSSFSG